MKLPVSESEIFLSIKNIFLRWKVIFIDHCPIALIYKRKQNY